TKAAAAATMSQAPASAPGLLRDLAAGMSSNPEAMAAQPQARRNRGGQGPASGESVASQPYARVPQPSTERTAPKALSAIRNFLQRPGGASPVRTAARSGVPSVESSITPPGSRGLGRPPLLPQERHRSVGRRLLLVPQGAHGGSARQQLGRVEGHAAA